MIAARVYHRNNTWVAQTADGRVYPVGDQYPFHYELQDGRDENKRVAVEIKPISRQWPTLIAYFKGFLV